MKKILGLLAAFILFSACDDGDMTFRTFNFTDAAPQACSGSETGTYYKINGTEVLIFNLNRLTDLLNMPTGTTPREVNIDLTYRNYSSTITLANLCANIPPSSPTVVEEWQGEGLIRIVTTPVYEEVNNNEPGDIDHITGYNHQLTLVSATFAKDGEEVTISNVNLGTIPRTLGFTFEFLTTSNPPASFLPCTSTNTYYRLNGAEALVVTLDPDALPAAVGTTTINLQTSTDENSVVFRVFGSSIGQNSICGSNPPITPVETQRWEANQGTLEIVTTEQGGGFRHILHLKDVRFRDTGSTAIYEPLPNDDYVIGMININN